MSPRRKGQIQLLPGPPAGPGQIDRFPSRPWGEDARSEFGAALVLEPDAAEYGGVVPDRGGAGGGC